MDEGPKNINKSIAYQEAAVVSREIIRKEGGTVTLFAFDKGQGLSEHKAPFDALVIITEGRAEVTVSGVNKVMEAGEMWLMRANSAHSLKASEAFKMMLVMIKS